MPLNLQTSSRLSLEVENHADSQAVFSIWYADQVHKKLLQPEDSGVFDINLPAGELDLTFRVDGPDGLYLWGAPHLREEDWEAWQPIILITLDTTRRDALSPYSGDQNVTPNIEEFAQQATVFENAYATAPWTLPSHASIFTGLYPSEHQAGLSSDHLGSRFTTLVELLHDRGYLTAAFAGGILCSSRFGLGQGFDFYRDPDGFETKGNHLTAQAVRFITNNHAEPFFLFLNYFDRIFHTMRRKHSGINSM